MVGTKYNGTQEKIDKLRSLKGKITLRFYQNITKYYDEKNYRR